MKWKHITAKLEKAGYVWHILQGKKKDISDNFITIITLVLIWELLWPHNRLRVEGNALISTAKREDGVTARKAGLSRQAAASLPALPATVLKKTASELCRARGQCRADAGGAARGARAERSRPRALPSRPSAPAERSQPPTKPRGNKAASGAVDRPAALKVPPASSGLSVRVRWGGHAVSRTPVAARRWLPPGSQLPPSFPPAKGSAEGRLQAERGEVKGGRQSERAARRGDYN